jgi:RNA polymerase sigma-70 factor (ECF subfamily)
VTRQQHSSPGTPGEGGRLARPHAQISNPRLASLHLLIVPPPKGDDPRSDLDLISALNDGDASAFDALYYRHRDWAARLAMRFTQNQDDAVDVVQETFAYLVRKFPGFRLTASLTTFLYPAVKHLALAARRKRLRASGGEERLDNLLAPPLSASTLAEPSDLAAVLSRLSEAHREVLLMRFVDGLALEEIAQALDVPLGTVKSRLHHALKALRDDPKTRDYFEP